MKAAIRALPRYKRSNFDQIATAVGMDVGYVAKHESDFEAAALWYRLDRRRPRRTAPSKLREGLNAVAKNARRLLKSLGVSILIEHLTVLAIPSFSMPWSCWAKPTRTVS